MLPCKVTSCRAQDPPGWLYLFTWQGDHQPRHVHVYRDGQLVLKWDLDNRRLMKGTVSRRVRKLIDKLEAEGLL